MRPILLSGHERALTQVKYNSDGDIIFSVSKDHVVVRVCLFMQPRQCADLLQCAWFSHNGERLGSTSCPALSAVE